MKIARPLALIAALAIPTALVIPQLAFAGDASAAAVDGDSDTNGRHGKKGRFAKMTPEERKALKARVKDKLQTFVTAELAEKAKLDDKKAEQLGEVIAAHMERREAAREQKHEAVKKLRQLVDDGANDANLNTQMKAVLAADDREEQMGTMLTETAKFLTPTEQARVMVELPHVMKKTMHMVREARGKDGKHGKQGKRGKRGQRGADAPDVAAE